MSRTCPAMQEKKSDSALAVFVAGAAFSDSALAVFVAGAASSDSILAVFVAGATFSDSVLAAFVAGAAFSDSVLVVFVAGTAFGNVGMEGIKPRVWRNTVLNRNVEINVMLWFSAQGLGQNANRAFHFWQAQHLVILSLHFMWQTGVR